MMKEQNIVTWTVMIGAYAGSWFLGAQFMEVATVNRIRAAQGPRRILQRISESFLHGRPSLRAVSKLPVLCGTTPGWPEEVRC